MKSEMMARGQSILVDTLSAYCPNDSSRAIAKSNPKGKVVLMQILVFRCPDSSKSQRSNLEGESYKNHISQYPLQTVLRQR